MARFKLILVFLAFVLLLPSGTSLAQDEGVEAVPTPSELLPVDFMTSDAAMEAPINNAAYYPADDAALAPALTGQLVIAQTEMQFEPEIPQPVCDGAEVEMGGSCRGGDDKRLLPAITLDLYTAGEFLVAEQIGDMLRDSSDSDVISYWRVIPQYGRIWHEEADGDWSRAALPLMLVHDMENHAHQGLATFLYNEAGDVTDLRFQFIQQTTPWNIPVHFVAWGTAEVTFEPTTHDDIEARRAEVYRQLAQRLPMRPWSDLVDALPPSTLDGFGGPLADEYIVTRALVIDGVIYYEESQTDYGVYPYPEEMRFGPRSVTKSITAPLALGRLAQDYGPYVLNLHIGDYVDGLDPEYDEVRFIDAANMATGMGGQGTFFTTQNNTGDGYVDAAYDDWYNGSFSNADKIEAITRDASPYPWGPGAIMRYRDRDYHLLGTALEGFLQSVEGADADIWDYVAEEVFEPIGIYQAPIVRTLEDNGTDGTAWFHAGIYVTLDDVAKVFTLYQNMGAHGGQQILHPAFTAQIFTTEGALTKGTDLSVDVAFTGDAEPAATGEELYKVSFHMTPHIDHSTGELVYLPIASGFAGNQIIMYPGDVISVRFAKSWPCDGCWQNEGPEDTIAAVNRMLGSFVE